MSEKELERILQEEADEARSVHKDLLRRPDLHAELDRRSGRGFRRGGVPCDDTKAALQGVLQHRGPVTDRSTHAMRLS